MNAILARLARLARVFPQNSEIDVVQTVMHFDASPEEVWGGMLFYEEVPSRPMALLRWFLPLPVRTTGEKTRAGERIECTYERGAGLTKRMTLVEAPSLVRFEVLTQRLGIEDVISMNDGSYELRANADGGTDVILSTYYRGHMRPRWLWRSLERYLAHTMHRHILRGMREVVDERATTRSPLTAMASGGQ